MLRNWRQSASSKVIKGPKIRWSLQKDAWWGEEVYRLDENWLDNSKHCFVSLSSDGWNKYFWNLVYCGFSFTQYSFFGSALFGSLVLFEFSFLYLIKKTNAVKHWAETEIQDSSYNFMVQKTNILLQKACSLVFISKTFPELWSMTSEGSCSLLTALHHCAMQWQSTLWTKCFC